MLLKFIFPFDFKDHPKPHLAGILDSIIIGRYFRFD